MGFYLLCVPIGDGRTFSFLAFDLNHANVQIKQLEDFFNCRKVKR